MPTSSPSRPQLAVYAALAVAVLLIGARFLRAGGGAPPGATPALSATTAAGAPDGLSGAGEQLASGRLVVDVKGAVRRPGVYRLAAGARVYDAVRRAGGLTGRADRVGVNLAARVADGGEVVVPARGAAGRAPAAAPAGADAPDAPLALDVNTASAQELEQLDGVGPATAAKIVAYREQHGGFASLDELDEVSGIGEAKLAAIRAQLGQ
ncbi:MAG: ComEA family DNA-binding protein [Actinobacteria bacterium]|nr:ComEA family DNA-binding protein [Actinomycetota bacterium]